MMRSCLGAAVLALIAAVSDGLRWGSAGTAPPSVDLIVVTHSSLQPSWVDPALRHLPHARLWLYCRGDGPVDPPCTRTGRIGGEEHAFLKHIVSRYDKLADLTIFTPLDLPANPTKMERLDKLLRAMQSYRADLPVPAFAAHEYYPVTRKYDEPSELCGPSLRPFGPWYLRFVNASDVDFERLACTAATLGNVFAVRLDRLRTLPRRAYENMLAEVEHCGEDSSPLVGYYLERSWAAMFSDQCHGKEASESLLRLHGGHQLPHEQLQVHATHVGTPERLSNRSVDFVVASYTAPLDWLEGQLEKLPGARLHLYCKGNSTDPRCIHLENVGTEEYAFLVHILRHYDDLADITVFTKDNMVERDYYHPTMLDCLNHITDKLNETCFRNKFQGFEAKIWFPISERFDLFRYHASAADGRVKLLCRPTISPYGNWYRHFINASDGSFEHMNCVASSMHGIFAVSKERIRRIPRPQFVDLLEEVESCRGHNAFTVGHYMERSWSMLFSNTCHINQALSALQRSQNGITWFNKRFERVTDTA